MEIVLVLLAVVVAGSAVLALERRRNRPEVTVRPGESVHRWVSARATTVDGVTAELHVEMVIVASAKAIDDALDRAVQEVVEATTRRTISSSRLDQLPDAGDSPEWLTAITVPGVRIEDAVVTSAEVWVTPELRRLVAGKGDGQGTWT